MANSFLSSPAAMDMNGANKHTAAGHGLTLVTTTGAGAIGSNGHNGELSPVTRGGVLSKGSPSKFQALTAVATAAYSDGQQVGSGGVLGTLHSSTTVSIVAVADDLTTTTSLITDAESGGSSSNSLDGFSNFCKSSPPFGVTALGRASKGKRYSQL